MKQISTTANNVHQLKIYCHYHPKEYLTEFCQNQECLQPLCRVCMPIHIFDHFNHKTKASIHPIQEMIAKTYKKIAEIANSMVEYSEFLTSEIQITLEYLIPSNPLELLNRAESEVINITKTYFDNLRTKLYSQSPELQSIENMKDIPNQLAIRWNILMTELEQLNTQEALSELIYYHQGDVQKSTFDYFHLTEEALNKLKSFQSNTSDLPTFNMNSECLDFIWNSLKQFANFGHDNQESQIEYSQQESKYENDQQQGVNQRELYLEQDNENQQNGLYEQEYSEDNQQGNGIDHDSEYEGDRGIYLESRQQNEQY